MAEVWTTPRLGTLEDPLRLAIFISGSGSGMESLLKYQQQLPRLHKTVVVICDQKEAAGIQKAQKLGIIVEVIPVPNINDLEKRRRNHETEIQKRLEEFDVEAIILSGYMRILNSSFVKKWLGRMLNIHPSLLPLYPGAHAHRDALADDAKESGCTVHFVDVKVDQGPIIAQERVQVRPNDNEFSLSERVKKIEHILYPKVIDDFAQGKVSFH